MAFRFKNIRKNKPHSQSGESKQQTLKSHENEATTSNLPKEMKLVATKSLPPIPEAETQETYKDHCKRLCKEMAKTKGRNLTLINEIMDCTFAMRRREIVEEPKAVTAILEKFPAITLPFEVCKSKE